jgi:hypothetical protein
VSDRDWQDGLLCLVDGVPGPIWYWGSPRCLGSGSGDEPPPVRATGRRSSRASASDPTEPECELVQIRLKVIDLDGSLVGDEQPPLGQTDDPMYAWQQLVSELAGCHVALVDIAVGSCWPVCRPAVGKDPGAWFDMVGVSLFRSTHT